MDSNSWTTASAIAAIVTPLVGVPLTVIIFYLKGLREQQAHRLAELSQRLDAQESWLRRVGEQLSSMQRDYATKEEWLRESMWARNQVEKLSESMTRTEAELECVESLRSSAERISRVVSSISERLDAACGPAADGKKGAT